MKAIYKRELRAYFTGMVGYVFVAFTLLLIGIYTTAFNFVGTYPNFEYVLYNINFIYLIIIPLLTMRALAEERHQKTDQLLYSSPLPITKVIVGKYLAMLTTLAIPLAISAFYPLILSSYGTVYLRATYSAILAFFLLGALLISVGLFLSSLTESQIIAAVITFAGIIFCYLSSALKEMVSGSANTSMIVFTALILAFMLIIRVMTKNWTTALSVALILEVILLALRLMAANVMSGAVTAVLGAFSVFTRMDNFMNGIFDVTALVYYISVIALFLFFSFQSVEKRRWS